MIRICSILRKLGEVKLEVTAGHGGTAPTTPTLSDQKSCHLRSKPGIFKLLVGPIIISFRFFSNGQVNLALLPPPLNLSTKSKRFVADSG